MKWETSPFEVSGRFAFYLVRAAIHMSNFYLVYENVSQFGTACDFREEFPGIFINFFYT